MEKNLPGFHIEKWKEFKIGEIIEIKGMPLKLIKVKKLKGELVLKHVERL